MGFFDFLRKKPTKQQEEVVIDVQIDDFERFLDLHLSEKLKSIIGEAEKRQKAIAKLAADAESLISELEKAEFSGGAEYAVVNMVKNNFVKRIKPAANTLKRDFVFEKYSDIENFHTDVAKLLAELKSSTPKEGVLISRYFGQHAAKIVSVLNSIDKEFKTFSSFSVGPAKTMERREKLIEVQEHITRHLEDLKNFSSAIAGMKANIESLDQEEASVQERFGKWKEAEMQKFEENKTAKENVDKQIEEIKGDVINSISFLEAPFKRMQHFTGDKFFSAYFENPFETILSDWDNFMKTASMVRVHLNEGKIELDKKDRKKVEMQSPRITEILPFLRKYTELNEKCKSLSEIVKCSESKISAFQNELNSINSKQKEIEMEIANNMKEMSRIKYTLQEKKSVIENGVLEVVGNKINLILPGDS